MVEEWETPRVLWTDYNESLAATIELSFASPTFCKLGPDAPGLLGVIAFFPHGIDVKNLDWLFPAIPDRKNIFDRFCALSLAYRNNGFITMFAPIRDYLGPKDLTSLPLLCMTTVYYFGRLSVNICFDMPGFEKTRWIMSEDVNVEHLLDAFTSIDTNFRSIWIWDCCAYFMGHRSLHKLRQAVLRPEIENLSDDHPSKF